MKSVAVIGAAGFVGSQIANYVTKSQEYELVPLVRGDDLSAGIKRSDIVVHAANSAKRFYAETNPYEDFLENVEKTARISEYARHARLILVSSISARTQLDTVYGRNRRSCELIVGNMNSLIVRLGPMFGAGKSVGALSDLLENRKVYVAGSTRYAYVDVGYNAKKITSYLGDEELLGCIELGAKTGICLRELRDVIGSTSLFEGQDDTQIPVPPPADAPGVEDVIAYVGSLRDSTHKDRGVARIEERETEC
jgi:nucleoside-diphosphate-sugar epimerase